MAEFCPRCGQPVDTGGDDSRLCDACGWFGDNAETAKTATVEGEFNPVRAAIRALSLYRDVCRHELIVEQIYAAGYATEAKLRTVRADAKECQHSLVELFTTLRRPHAPP
jgi:hypothetical protein